MNYPECISVDYHPTTRTHPVSPQPLNRGKNNQEGLTLELPEQCILAAQLSTCVVNEKEMALLHAASHVQGSQ